MNSTALSDGEIYNLASQEWIDTLSGLWALYGKDIQADETRFRSYVRVLSFVPLGLLEEMIDRCAMDAKGYGGVPNIEALTGKLREICKEVGIGPVDIPARDLVTQWVALQSDGIIRWQ